MDWFDSDYYHILYKNRDYNEARNFINNIIKHTSLKKGSKILDLACGIGRHSIYLEKIGYKVTGIDRSANNIKIAKTKQNKNLRFLKMEMTCDSKLKYDAIFNLFTSFGYLNHKYNLDTIKNIGMQLNQDGLVIIDFMNVEFVKKNLIRDEVKKVENITFKIKRNFDQKYIYKDIRFKDKKNEHFKERVMNLGLEDFKFYLQKNDFKIVELFGNYELESFDIEKSQRLIMLIKKSQSK